MVPHPSREDLQELAGASLFVGIHEAEPGPGLDRFLAQVRPGGAILFARNVGEAETLARLNRALRGDTALPRLVGVDEEGGRVQRLAPLLGPLPPAAALGRAGARRTRATAALLGHALAALGFNLDFAPVLDVCAPEAPNGIGDRAFGDDPAAVAGAGAAFRDGLLEAGLLPVAKHFPGLGPTDVDSHEVLPRASGDERTFRHRHLQPFADVLPGTPAVMVGHAHYPFLDPSAVPASCSRRVVSGLLRDELRYPGLAIADDLEMKAVDQGEGWLDAACAALEAGCDMVLLCHSRERVFALRDELVRRVQAGRFPVARLRGAAVRIGAARQRAAACQGGSFPAARDALRRYLETPG